MNYSKTALNRRAFLYAAGTAGVALPFLEGLPERSAFAQSNKPVFGLFICTANGVVQRSGPDPERFWPTAFGALTKQNMEASAAERCTGLLADYADRLLILKGISYPQGGVTGCGHAQGLSQCLTAAPPTGSGNTTTSTGPSVDTLIAQRLNPQGVEPLALYSGVKGNYIAEKLSFRSAGQVRAAEGNPYNVYQRITGLQAAGGGGGSPVADQLALRRNSVNDLVRDQINHLKSRPQLSKADRDRLDLHFTSIRDMEETMMQMASSCVEGKVDQSALNALNTGSAFRQNGNVIEDVAKLQIELAALTFACNNNRVATLQVGDGTDGTRYTIPGVNNGQQLESFHHISHRIRGDGTTGASIAGAVDFHAAIDRFRMGTFKHLLTKWSEYSTPDGPLLDNAFAMWTSHVAEGPSHALSNLPILIAGSAGGFLKQGQYIDVGPVRNRMLFNTLLTAMGIPTEDFGSGGGMSGTTGLLRNIMAGA